MEQKIIFMDTYMSGEDVKNFIAEKGEQYLEIYNKIISNPQEIDKLKPEEIKDVFLFVKSLRDFTENSKKNSHQDYDEEVMAVQEELRKLLPKLHQEYYNLKDGKKKNPHSQKIIKILFSNKTISNFFKSFVFDMKNGHNGSYENKKIKNIHFPTSLNLGDSGGFIFRFLDNVYDAISIYHNTEKRDNALENMVIHRILTGKIFSGCGCCNRDNKVILNFKERTIIEADDKKCSYINQEGESANSFKVRMSFPTGKGVLLKDRTTHVHNMLNFRETHFLQQKHKIPLSGDITLNTQGGQRAIANLNAIEHNVGIVFGTEGYKQIQTHKDSSTLIGFNDKSENYKEEHFFCDYWAYAIMDKSIAQKILGDEYNEAKVVEFDIAPGTYDLRTIFYGDDYEKFIKKKVLKNQYTRANIKKPEAVLIKVSDEKELIPFTPEQLSEYIPVG